MALDRIWIFAAALGLGLILICGGVSLPTLPMLTFLVVIGIVLIVLGTMQLIQFQFSGNAKVAFLVIFLGFALLLGQIAPLPPNLWSAFPGREFVNNTYQAIGLAPRWAALSLDPIQTRADLLMTVPAVGLFIAALTIKPEQRKYLVLVMLVVALASVLLGLAQKFQGPYSPLFIYDIGGLDSASGFFANRNFYSALLYTMLPFVIAYAVNWSRIGKTQKIIGPAFAFVFIAFIIIGLGASGSRMGVILAFVAILLSLPMIWSSQSFNIGSRGLIVILFVFVLLIAQFGLVAILRLASTDSVSEYRTTIYSVSTEVLRNVFPVGTGFGSFVPIYAMHETPSVVSSNYVNHAHNDWLELLIEGGLPMAILLFAYLVWYAVATYKMWTRGRDLPDELLVKAASISIVLLLIHSFFDYPLRTPALLGLFAVLNGFLAYGPQTALMKIQARRSPSSIPVETPRQMPASEFKSNFKSKKTEPKIET